VKRRPEGRSEKDRIQVTDKGCGIMGKKSQGGYFGKYTHGVKILALSFIFNYL
jgi:hypothetical protein